VNPEPKVPDSRGRRVLLKALETVSQEELSLATEVPQSIISLIVNRQRLPGRKASVAFRKAGVDPSWWDEPPEQTDAAEDPAA